MCKTMYNKSSLLLLLGLCFLFIPCSPYYGHFHPRASHAGEYVRAPWSIRYRRYNHRKGPIWKSIRRLIAQHYQATKESPGKCKAKAPSIKQDDRHGFERNCLARNHIVEEGNWLLGRLNGVWNIKTFQGQPIAQIPYVKGRLEGTLKVWHRNGKPWVSCDFRNEYKHGVCWWWHFNGKPLSVGTYRDNDRHGKVVHWFRSGKKLSSCNYKYDQAQGHCFRWYQNGQKLWDRFYDQGKAVGTWKMWFKNGQLMSIRHFEKGKPCGVSKFWLDDGKLVNTGKFPPCKKPTRL